MPDDANFCNGRLRLAAFLRVVERDMPQRPSRFKRRVSLVEEEHGDSGEIEPLANSEEPSSPQISEGVAVVTHNLLGEPPESTHEYDVPRSPTPIGLNPDLHIGVDSVVVPEDAPAVTSHLANKVTTHMRKAVGIVHTPASKKSLRKSHGSSNTRKRRLPVNGLAMLRTTTSDGLPEPGDAIDVLAVPITEADPIQDSQLTASLAPDSLVPDMPHTGDMKPEKSMANGIRHQPPSRIFYAVQPPRSLISALREPAAPMKSQQVCRTGLQFVADGFVGCELDVISTTKPRQRARIDSRKGKHPSVGSALALASGSLPLPPNQGEVLSIVSQHVTTELSQSSVLAYSHEQAATAPSQLTLTKTQGTTENASPYHLSLTRWESAIRNQLSSIIAPVRRHSESSESEAITEHQSTLDDEDTFEDDSTEDTTYNPVHLGRRPTFSDDHSYFKRAMQELD